MDIGKVGIWFFLDAMTAPESDRGKLRNVAASLLEGS